MNKKFLVVALMAALSSVGYAYDPVGTNQEGNNKIPSIAGIDNNFTAVQNDVDKINNSLAGQNQVIDGLNNQIGNLANDFIANKDEQANIDAGQNQVIDGLNNQIGNLANDFIANKENQEKVDAEQDKVIANKADKNYVDAENKKQDEVIKDHGDRLGALESNYAQYDGRLSGLEKKVDHLDDKMNKGLSLMAAMNAVDFQNVQTGEMALGAGIGHYGNAQSVALGVAYSPVEDLTVNAKYSVTAGDVDSFALGAGATYKFKVGR